MASIRAQTVVKETIVAMLHDVQTLCSEVFTPRSLRLTTDKVVSRIDREGIGFLTKTLPRLAKAFDRALTGETLLDARSLRFDPLPSSKLPRFLGELFQRCFDSDGRVLQTPCIKSIRCIRDVLYCFYKYEIPYNSDEADAVVRKFITTEDSIRPYHVLFETLARYADSVSDARELYGIDARVPWFQESFYTAVLRGQGWRTDLPGNASYPAISVIRTARRLLSEVFRGFDVMDIKPRHGPGAVATKEQRSGKYTWTCVPSRITDVYPFDAYFTASLGATCDQYRRFDNVESHELPARVILVPKDSRGPRLISCEPLAFQWVQQGLGRAIVKHLESHPLTRWNIHFTDQQPNQAGALLGSWHGRYATLDLAEASDRVTVGLVRLLFPEPLQKALLACRSQSTVLPSGEVKWLNKYAPMGSALCFPVLACSIWAILTAGIQDAEARDSLLVYGDDVVVQTAQAENATMLLESFGFKVNRDKSCTSGLFRESCGVDAFMGADVTPVRFRTVWQSSPRSDVYTSWIAYANQLWHKQYRCTYDVVVGRLFRIYREIPATDQGLPCPSLAYVPECFRPKRVRSNQALQRREWYVRTTRAHEVVEEIDGWSMLLRYFAETDSQSSPPFVNDTPCRCGEEILCKFFREEEFTFIDPISVREYTPRDSSRLTHSWLAPIGTNGQEVRLRGFRNDG